MIGIVDIITARKAWETSHWGVLTPPLTAFLYFPTQDEMDQGLVRTPFTCHQVELSTGANVSINHLNSVEDIQTHRFWNYLMFGKPTDALHVLTARDAEWRDRFRSGHLLHMMNSMTGGGGIQENIMGPIEPLTLDLWGVEWQGIKSPSTVTVRQTMPTAN